MQPASPYILLLPTLLELDLAHLQALLHLSFNKLSLVL